MESHLSWFWDFLSIIDDHKSMIILVPLPPENSPSVDTDSIRKCVNFKKICKGELLILDDTPVLTFGFNSDPPSLTDYLSSPGSLNNLDHFKPLFSPLFTSFTKRTKKATTATGCVPFASSIF